MLTGSLQIKNDRYYVVLNLKEDGKYKKKWITTKLSTKGNKRKATEFLNNILNEYSALNFQNKKESIKFTDYLDKWLESKKGKIEQSTWEGYYNSTVKHLIPYFEKLDLDIQSLKPKHIIDYYEFKFSGGRRDGKSGGLSNKSIKEHSVVIKNALNNAVIEELIDRNPSLNVPLPKRKEETKRVFLNAEQANELLKLFRGHRLQPLVYITLYYGLRRSEVLGLKWNAVDFENHEIRINHTVVRNLTVVAKDRTKSECSRRKYFLLPEVEELLKNVKKSQQRNQKLFGKEYKKSDYIFTWENGRPYNPNYITSAFQKHLKKNNFPKMRFHDLRHSCASILYDKGWSLKDIQEWLGHADLETTGDIYTHISQSRKEIMANNIKNTFFI